MILDYLFNHLRNYVHLMAAPAGWRYMRVREKDYRTGELFEFDRVWRNDGPYRLALHAMPASTTWMFHPHGTDFAALVLGPGPYELGLAVPTADDDLSDLNNQREIRTVSRVVAPFLAYEMRARDVDHAVRTHGPSVSIALWGVRAPIDPQDLPPLLLPDVDYAALSACVAQCITNVRVLAHAHEP